MTSEFWTQPRCHPFAEPNPFAMLRARPRTAVHELGALAKQAIDDAEGEPMRRAIRHAAGVLTRDPVARCAWALWTPSASFGADTGCEERLGRWLFAGPSPSDASRPYLAALARWLGWSGERQPARDDELARRWASATRRCARRWEFWHQLALAHSFEAHAADEALQAHEARCVQGVASVRPAQHRVDALWMRALVCWERALESGELQAHALSAGAHLSDAERERAERLDLARTLVDYAFARVQAPLSDGNALTTARRARWLKLVAANDALPLFGAPARERFDTLRGAWLNDLATASAARGPADHELVRLLLFHGDDLEVAHVVFAALANAVQRASENDSDGDKAQGLALCRSLALPAQRVVQRVFPYFPDASVVQPDAVAARALLEYHWLLGSFGSDEERRQHVACHTEVMKLIQGSTA